MTRIRKLIAALGAASLVAGLAAPTASGADGCRFTSIRLAGFSPGSSFYVVTESDVDASFIVRRDGDNCVDGEYTDVFLSLDHTSTSPSELSIDETTVRLYAPTDGSRPGQNTKAVGITPVDDQTTDEGVKTATVRTDRAQHSGQDTPSYFNRSAPLYLVDDDETAAPFALADEVMRGSEGLTLRIPVFRAGPISGSQSVAYSIEGGSATPGEDYDAAPTGTVDFDGASRFGLISVQLISDGYKEGDENFFVNLVGPGVSSQSQTIVTIGDTTVNDLRPTGRLHHPKRDFRYPQNYPWLNEIHIFTTSADESELKVNKAQLALRKRLKDGACAWWQGNGFLRGKCGAVDWFGKGIKNPSRNYFKYNLRKKLDLSVGTKVRDYTIWGRWYDDQGHVSLLKKGRNLNRFEVIKPCRGDPYNFRRCKAIRP